MSNPLTGWKDAPDPNLKAYLHRYDVRVRQLEEALERMEGQMRRAKKRIEGCYKHTTVPDDTCTCGAAAAVRILGEALNK